MDELRNKFDRLGLIIEGEPAIRFADPEILRILTTEKVFCNYNSETSNIGYLTLVDRDGDGMITKDEVEKVHCLSNRADTNGGVFGGNTVIETFHEFKYFTGLTKMNGLFTGCTTLKEITFPPITGNNTTVAAGGMFSQSGIRRVILPEGYTAIGENFCNGAQYCILIDLPSTITSIGNGIIWAVNNKVTIVCRATIPPALGGFGYNGYAKAIYVPDESVSAYKSATNWNLQAARIYSLSTYVEL